MMWVFRLILVFRPEIIRIILFLQRPLWFISRGEPRASQENYCQIGAALHCSKSPKRKPHASRSSYSKKEPQSVFMWECATGHPFTEEAITNDRIERLVLYPHPQSLPLALVVPASWKVI